MEEIALTAGKDYSLLFTFDGKKENILKQKFSESFSGTDFSVIGEVKEGDADVRFFKMMNRLNFNSTDLICLKMTNGRKRFLISKYTAAEFFFLLSPNFIYSVSFG